jgi:hypothetical protein
MMNLSSETQGKLRQLFDAVCSPLPPDSATLVLLTVSRKLELNGGR